jgi:hypothetical protein
MTLEAATALRRPFPKESIGQLPKGGVMLDFVGHAAVVDRLLAVDPEWTWDFAETDPATGKPSLRYSIDPEKNLWIRLTVCGVSRIGVGDGPTNKERIGDAIRNAGMRFGIALDLWARESLVEFAHAAQARATKPALAPGVSVVPAVAPLSADEAFAAFAPEAAAREAAERIAAETGLDQAHKQAGGGSSEGEASGPSPAVVSPGSSAAAGVEPAGGVVPTSAPPAGAKKATRATQRMIFATLGTLGVTDDDEGYERKLIASRITGRHVYSFNDLTTGEASRIIDTLAGFSSSADLYAHLDTLPDPS